MNLPSAPRGRGSGRPPRGGIQKRGIERPPRHHSKFSDIIMTDPNPSTQQSEVTLRVKGWNVPAAGDRERDRVEKLKVFLDVKASKKAGGDRNVRIKAMPRDGNDSNWRRICVHQDHADYYLKLNNFTFVGQTLIIERVDTSRSEQSNARTSNPASNGVGQPATPSSGSVRIKLVLKNFINMRYIDQCLHLENYQEDITLRNTGLFDSAITKAKFFPALMKVCDEIWDTPEKKAAMVPSISLCKNKLKSVSEITTLAITFPQLMHLDLSDNDLKSIDSLKFWRWRFRDLETLFLSGNDVASEPGMKETMLKWFPKLKNYNGEPVGAGQANHTVEHRPRVMAACFRDEQNIAVNFLTDFFPLFDLDRPTLVDKYYDSDSRYSMSVNNKVRRLQTEVAKHPDLQPHLKNSRDLLSITHLNTRSSRSHKGQKEILDAWAALLTRHPSLQTQPRGWAIECHPIRGLDDPTGTTSGGVSGLIIMVHGYFVDMNAKSAEVNTSFDRTFILGPGNGVGGIRVVSDTLVLRPVNISTSWGYSDETKNLTGQPFHETVAHEYKRPEHPEISAINVFGLPQPLKTEETLLMERSALELCQRIWKLTRQWLRLTIAGDCLIKTNWDIDHAMVWLDQLITSGELPRENAFVHNLMVS